MERGSIAALINGGSGRCYTGKHVHEGLLFADLLWESVLGPTSGASNNFMEP